MLHIFVVDFGIELEKKIVAFAFEKKTKVYSRKQKKNKSKKEKR